jgi:hypothetical protein
MASTVFRYTNNVPPGGETCSAPANRLWDVLLIVPGYISADHLDPRFPIEKHAGRGKLVVGPVAELGEQRLGCPGIAGRVIDEDVWSTE